jgi:hypothetical protein
MTERSFGEPVAAKEFTQEATMKNKRFSKDDIWFIKFGLIMIAINTVLLVLNIWLEGK